MRDNLIVVPFVADHVKNMELLERDKWLEHNGNIFLFAQRHERMGVGYTVMYNASVTLGCGGIDIMWENVGEAWMLLTPYIKLYPLFVTKIVKKYFSYLIDRMGLKRVQATIRSTDDVSIRYVEMLNFQREGTLRCFGTDGCDYFMYGRVQ